MPTYRKTHCYRCGATVERVNAIDHATCFKCQCQIASHYNKLRLKFKNGLITKRQFEKEYKLVKKGVAPYI